MPTTPVRDKLAGTSVPSFQIGLLGPQWVDNAGALDARNSPNTAYVVVHVAEPDYTAPAAITYADFMLASEPPYGAGYSTTYTGLNLTLETWTNTSVAGSPTMKTIAYTYTGLNLTQEVRKVFATDGVTIIAELTLAYTYTGTRLTSATYTRNV
jgi:hypothetical protein